ncbi:hypothetical protein BLNAU_6954 [Blattamonas nauphoetae]|uniref:Uncharacterized protein n=1 Tax=Blattamonas nauphoetae TaxID=2049346 RepID=A0ABQ9Y2V6_9EUKA|nr:hypothetical protein BLNAU_6954 [Blattamonas nauphoetae]
MLHLLSIHLLYPIFFAIALKENFHPLYPMPNAPAGTIAEGLRSRHVFLGISRTNNPSDTTANRFNFIYSTLVRFFKVPPPAIPLYSPLLTSPPRFIKAPFIPDAIFDLVQSTETMFLEPKAKAKATSTQLHAPSRRQNIPALTQNVPLNPRRPAPGPPTMQPYVPSQRPVPGPPITMQPFVPSQSTSQVMSIEKQAQPQPKTYIQTKPTELIRQIDLSGWVDVLAMTNGQEEEKTRFILTRNRGVPGFRDSLDKMNKVIEERLTEFVVSKLKPTSPDQPPKNTSDTESWLRFFRVFWILFLEVYDTTQNDPPTLSPDIPYFGENNLHRFILLHPFCNPNDVEEDGPKLMEERTEIFWANEILLSISRFFIKLQRTARPTFDHILKRIDIFFNEHVAHINKELGKDVKRTLTKAEESRLTHIAAFLVMLVDSGFITKTKQNIPNIPQDEQKEYERKMRRWRQDRETFEKQFLAKIKKRLDESKLGWIELNVTKHGQTTIGPAISRKIRHPLKTNSTYQDLRLSLATTENVQPTSVHLFWFGENYTESVAELPEVLFEREYDSLMNVIIDLSNPVALTKVEIPYPDSLKTEPSKPQDGRASYPPLMKTPVTVDGFKIDDIIELFRKMRFSSPTLLSASTLLFNSLTFSPKIKFNLSEGKDVDWNLAIQSNMFMDVQASE